MKESVPNMTKAVKALPPDVEPGQSIHLNTEGTHSLTGVFGVTFQGTQSSQFGVERFVEDALFINVHPTTKPGEYEVYGRYARESTYPVEKHHWGTVTVKAPNK